MPDIRQLPPSVINKIAAGEVIERPASVVKELLENSVDAGASRIDVTVEQGGRDCIRVSDNGVGVPADQLPLAVTSHATSKIRDADDLFRVGTLGFRGEALASIAEISQFQLTSRPADATAGARLEVDGGHVGSVQPCGCPVGTVVSVKNLFFNTPVRRKFLRTTQTEMGHVTEAFARVALAHPEIHFVLQNHQRTLFDLPVTDQWRSRIAALYGSEIADALIWVENRDGSIHLSGYVADPIVSRANNRMAYLFLNGRYIRDRSLLHALSEAYRGLLMTGRFPIVFLRMDVQPDAVDVNVHPTKLEVRFQDGGHVYSQLLGTLRSHFLTTDLTARVQPPTTPFDSSPTPSDIDPVQAARHRDDVVRWAQGGPSTNAGAPTNTEPRPPAVRQPALGLQYPPIADSATLPRTSEPRETPPNQPEDSSPPGVDLPPSMGTTPEGHPALQVHNRYLITESQEGVVVIDQHALHERILYEELREKVLAGALETQSLLVPEPVRLAPAEAAAVLESRDLLHQLGMEVAPFGGDTVLVSSYPAMLANIQPEELLRQLVEKLLAADQDQKLDRRDVLDQLLHMISCKAAIKAGDRLSREEISALVERRQLVQDSHHCPHGRPTVLVFTREELDRRFKRV